MVPELAEDCADELRRSTYWPWGYEREVPVDGPRGKLFTFLRMSPSASPNPLESL
jgi:hypothetical protein